MGGSTVHWNFSKWDWAELVSLLVPVFFVVVFGVLLTVATGALVIHLLLEALLGQ